MRGRDAVLLRDGEPVARVADLPWEGEDPDHWQNARADGDRLVLAGRLGPDNVRAAIDAVASMGGGRRLAARVRSR